MKRLFLFLAIVATTLTAEAQESFKFGKVTKADLLKTDYPIAADADAVVLDEYIQDGFFYHNVRMEYGVFRQHIVARRIKILSDEGLNQLKFNIQFETDEAGGIGISEFYAQRYTLDNNKVVHKVFSNDNIEIEHSDNLTAIAKIDLSDAKVGDIIEYNYVAFITRTEQIINTDMGRVAPTVSSLYEAVVFNGNDIALTAVTYGDAEITQTREQSGRLIYYTSFGGPNVNSAQGGAVYNYSSIPVKSGGGTNRASMVYSFKTNNTPVNAEPSGVRVILPNDGIKEIRQISNK